MTGIEFITYVKAKLNRLDTNSYEDVRKEEVIFFANEALKKLILEFDGFRYSQGLDIPATKVYLAGLTAISGEVALTANAVAMPALLKVKGARVFVVAGTEQGWVVPREYDNEKSFDREENPFTMSYADAPVFRLIDGKMLFTAADFQCTKVQYEYLKLPVLITEGSTLTYPFMEELQNSTVTIILENLEGRRLQTQVMLAKS